MERSLHPDDIAQRKAQAYRNARARAHSDDVPAPGVVYMIDNQAKQIEQGYSRGYEPMRQAIVYDKARGKWQIADSNSNIPVTPRSNLVKASNSKPVSEPRIRREGTPRLARHERTARGQW